jgi:hypothetical protein
MHGLDPRYILVTDELKLLKPTPTLGKQFSARHRRTVKGTVKIDVDTA